MTPFPFDIHPFSYYWYLNDLLNDTHQHSHDDSKPIASLVKRDLKCLNQLKHGHWGCRRTVFVPGFPPKSRTYFRLNTPTKIGQPEIPVDLIIRKAPIVGANELTLIT